MFDDDRRMIFASAFDGDWEKYVQDFGTSKVGAIIDRNLQHCEDWGGITDPGASENLLSYAVPAVQYESAYPEPSVRQVWKALGFAEGVPAGAGRPRRRRSPPAPGPQAAAGAGRRLTPRPIHCVAASRPASPPPVPELRTEFRERKARPMSDHFSGPRALAGPAGDICDVYAFPSPERPGHLVLVMNVQPLASAGFVLLGCDRLPLPAAAAGDR